MKFKLVRTRAITLVMLMVTLAIFTAVVTFIIYLGRSICDSAQTISHQHEHQITNLLADDALNNAPAFWITTTTELPDEDLPSVLATVHLWRIEAAPSLQGPWTFTGNEFISDERFLRDIMLTIAAADSMSDEPRWFYRGVHP